MHAKMFLKAGFVKLLNSNKILNILHKKENTIHTWLKRAKKQLKDRLGGDYFE